MITVAIALAIVGAVTAFVVTQGGDAQEAPPAPEGVTAAQADCDEVQELEEEGNGHVNGDVEYETSPPSSGDHSATPADAGFYPDEVPEETLVHNLEHGQIVIWYSPDADEETRNDLRGLVESANDPAAVTGQSQPPLLAAPHDDLPAGKSLVLTAWTASQACGAYSLDAINEFRAEYQGQGPEQATAPFEGEHH